MNSFPHIVSQYISQHALLGNDEKCLVALSGGADSVALLRVLLALGYAVHAVHCNFHLRGEESDRDEKFCKDLCEELNVPFHVTHFDTKFYAESHKVSIEMAARTLRYRYFDQLAASLGIEKICVAHHRDDSVETILMNLIRGTGIDGLTGIKPRTKSMYSDSLIIVRPLLCVSRSGIEKWLKELGQKFVVDSTNLVDDVVRNKLRLNVIPQLVEINPSAIENIALTAENLNQTALVANDAIGKTCQQIVSHKEDRTVVSLSELRQTMCPEAILFHVLKPYGFKPSQIRQIASNLNVQSGRSWQSKTHDASVFEDTLIIMPADFDKKSYTFPMPSKYVLSSGLVVRISEEEITQDFVLEKNDPNVVMLDADLVKFPLKLRLTEKGDRFHPLGMKGTKLVSDFLTDRHVSLLDKRRQYVLTDSEGNIVWVVSLRPDHRFRITEKSKKVLKIVLVD